MDLTGQVLSRRQLLAALGASSLATLSNGRPARAASRTVTIRAATGAAALRVDQPASDIWMVSSPQSPLRFAKGDDARMTFTNDLQIPAVLSCRGLDGAVSAQPLLTNMPVQPGARATLNVPLRRAGTYFCDVRLLGDGLARPAGSLPLIVEDGNAIGADQDQVLLVEEWRLRPDGQAIAPGAGADDAVPIFTVNGRPALDLPVRANERLRLRLINGCQRTIVAIKIDNEDVRVIAIDGQPAEPFPARDGQLVLAPGTRIDVIVDAARPPGSISTIRLHDGTQPRPVARLVYASDPPVRDAPLMIPAALPANDLPARLDLAGALRTEIGLRALIEPSPSSWVAPGLFKASSAPAFRVKRGRTVVIALTNPAPGPIIFHLHGHHFRLLDRLDDGWKPFWLDTLMVGPTQTQRIAFQAEFAGAWLLESVGTDWTAPRLLRWYEVS